jgi:hypothetical protein
MNLRKVKRKKSRWVGLIVLFAIMSSILLAGVLLVRNSEQERPKDTLVDLDSRATNISIFQSFFAAQNTKDQFSYKLNSIIEFMTWDQEGVISLQNPSGNQHLMALEIVLEDNNQVVFRSGYLKPGQQIKKASLDILVAQGIYRASAHIWAIDAESLELLDLFEEPIELIIKN